MTEQEFETVESNQLNGKRKSSVKAKKTSTKKTKADKIKLEWNFPKNTLEEAIEIAKAIEDKNGGDPTDAADLAKMVGFNKPDWRFTDLLRSANFYGIVEGKGAMAKVSLTDIGIDIVAPSNPNQRQNALLKAFRNVLLFKEVSDYYQGKKIPEDEYFSNTLSKNFSIPRERISAFIDVFQKKFEFSESFCCR
jgi:hypothetical protein